MAGMPLFAHVGRENLIPPPLSVPLKLIKFRGSETPKSPFKVLRRRWFLPVLLRKTGKNARKAVVLSAFYSFAFVLGFRKKLFHRPPESIKFPMMPVARHENQKSPAMPSAVKKWLNEGMRFAANPPTPCRFGKHLPAPETWPAIEKHAVEGGTTLPAEVWTPPAEDCFFVITFN